MLPVVGLGQGDLEEELIIGLWHWILRCFTLSMVDGCLEWPSLLGGVVPGDAELLVLCSQCLAGPRPIT